ncbi:MAG: anti-sigma regulatory factor [Methylococcales bacterium]|nr:anti-sigma regulatory factor [Methylococcales bacterium]MDD5754763.1 anti-sigma regulatory factor [Methylococcales bacterium]
MANQEAGENPIKSEGDIVTCRKLIRNAAVAAGFGMTDVTRIVTAVSELARNVYVHSGSDGVMRWEILHQPGQIGIHLEFEDYGKGIPDVDQAMEVGFTTAGTMGMGLSGVKRLMDDINIKSEVGVGTTITVEKWGRAK